ncbi:30S ribosomal protein S9 [bacterium]|nr:30S ribosomal protein S9 [bacterium]
MPKAHYKYTGTGKRKTSVARIYMNEGSGQWTVNGKAHDEYFPTRTHQISINRPFTLLGLENKYDVKVTVAGGGITGQAEAIMYGLSKALLAVNEEENRPKLKADGLLTRDARETERKKYGQPGARKRFQYSKR